MNPADGSDRGVSQVVATLFVVATVILLGSVTTVYFFDIVETGTQEPAPQASFSFLQNGNAVTITHEAGDGIQSEELSLSIGDTREEWSSVGSAGTVSSGKSAQVTVSGNETVKIIWQSQDSDRTAVLAERSIIAPVNPTFTGTNKAIKSTNADGSYLGFGDKRLEGEGYSPAGHFRIAPYKSSGYQLQVRDASGVITRTAYSPAPSTQHSFTLTYDGSTLKLTAGGSTVQTNAFSVEEDALTIQVKRAGSDITTAEVSNLKLDGASIGSPDEIIVSSPDQKSLLIESAGLTDGFTLIGEFTFDASGSPGGEDFVVRIDVA